MQLTVKAHLFVIPILSFKEQNSHEKDEHLIFTIIATQI